VEALLGIKSYKPLGGKMLLLMRKLVMNKVTYSNSHLNGNNFEPVHLKDQIKAGRRRQVFQVRELIVTF
jgi:hypothetical protein